jgi:nickel transport system substrate-binding protein
LPLQSGVLLDVGFLNPHAYGPNELFAQNWVFEGLVSYGPGGTLLPALATSWTTTANTDSSVTLTFQLRQGVTFHDGRPWDADACKLNFDNGAQTIRFVIWYCKRPSTMF